ncbi:MAG: FecR domain-containing protein [Deltaproteobacteria bacterium]|nr:FecR domain-containing protein [Deltaproteobacteria bacterium]
MHLVSRLVFVFILGFVSLPLVAADSVGEVVFVRGEVSLFSISESGQRIAAFGDKIYQMDTLQTGAGELRVLFTDKTLLSLGPNSKVLVTEHLFRPQQGGRRSLFDILKGSVRVLVDEATSFRVNDVRFQTPTAVATVRGTDLGIRLLNRSSQFFCFDGLLETYFREEPEAKVMLHSGQYTEIKNAPPTPAAPIPSGLGREFQSVSEASDLREVLDQPGGVGGPEVLEPEKEVARVVDQPPPAPVVPSLIPGGETSTPESVKPAATEGKMKVPLKFPGR